MYVRIYTLRRCCVIAVRRIVLTHAFYNKFEMKNI